MRVVCTSNQHGDRSLQITVGQTYLVAQVVIERAAGSVMMRLAEDDQGVPGLYESALFDISDPEIPQGWAFVLHETSGAYCMGPSSFAQAGFWEQYFDGEQAALDRFDAAIQDMNGRADQP